MATGIVHGQDGMDPAAAVHPAVAPGHRRDVQVLRAVAVTAVVLYHCQVVLPGGFVGVDVFFVISGFVIGRGLLARLQGDGSVGLRTFWWRRANRLLPALAVTLAVVVALAPLLGPVGSAQVTPRTAVSASFSVANLYLLRAATDGYFDAAVELNPLLHTWSLSLEEQIYLVVPVLLGAAWAVGRRTARPLRWARAVVAVLVVTSFAAAVALTDVVGTGLAGRVSFFSPVTRVWEFGVGLGLVLLPAAALRRLPERRLLFPLGAVMIGTAALTLSDTTPYPGMAAALPVVGTALVLLGGRPAAPSDGPVPSWRRPVEALGDISYGWYLWHWPLIVFAAAAWPLAGSAPRVLAASVALLPAWWSARHLERRGAAVSPPTRRSVLRVGAIALAPVLLVVATWPLTTEVLERSATAWYSGAQAPHADEANGCSGTESLDEREIDRCRFGTLGGGGRVVLVGDSNAGQFSEAMIGAAQRDDAELTIATSAGCPFLNAAIALPIEGASAAECQAFVQGTVDRLVADPPEVVVIAVATDYYLFYEGATVAARVGDEPVDGVDERARVLRDGLARVMSRLDDAGIRVVLVHVAPKPWAAGLDLDSRGCSAVVLSRAPQNCRMPPYRADNPVTVRAVQVEDAAATAAGAETWDVGTQLCPDEICVEVRGDEPVWAESFHISVAASERLVDRMSQLLDRGA